MREALAALSELQPAPWETIVWAGPGYGAGLDTLAGMDSRLKLLLEPHPALNRRLASRARGTSLRIDARALADAGGTGDFHLMSDPVRSTLLDVATVLRERPNLRPVDTIRVDLLTPAALVEELDLEEGAYNLLILDDTGMEPRLLRGDGKCAVQAFSHVLVGGSHGSTAIPAGFDVATGLPARPGQQWRLYVRQRAAAPRDEHAGSRERLQVLESQVQELEGQLEALGSERDELVHQCRDLDALLSGHQEQLRQADEDGVRTRQALASRDDRIAELEAALEAQRQRVSELEQAVSAGERARELAEARVAQQQARLGELDERLKESAQSARLATRLQALREQDLRELQERYDEALRVQEHQHALLVQVGDRLGAAASHFHALADAGKLPATPEVVVYRGTDGETDDKDAG